jgi:hypothetical protein
VVGQKLDIVGVETHRLIEIGERLVQIAFQPVGPAAILQGQTKVGLQLERLVEIRDGAVILCGPDQRVAAVVKSFGNARLEADRLVIFGDASSCLFFAASTQARWASPSA